MGLQTQSGITRDTKTIIITHLQAIFPGHWIGSGEPIALAP